MAQQRSLWPLTGHISISEAVLSFLFSQVISLYRYAFFEAAVDTDEKFKKAMDSLVRGMSMCKCQLT